MDLRKYFSVEERFRELFSASLFNGLNNIMFQLEYCSDNIFSDILRIPHLCPTRQTDQL